MDNKEEFAEKQKSIQNPEIIKSENITFENQHNAKAISVSSGDTADLMLKALGIAHYRAVIVVIGGAAEFDTGISQFLTQLFSRGIAPAAIETNAVVIDGGTQAGVMALIGKAVADRDYKTQLIGVAPKKLVCYPGSPRTDVSLDPNHSHFVLVDGDKWGDETTTLFKLTSALINKKNTSISNKELEVMPALTILAGGGPISKTEILKAVRLKIPVVAIKGSGGFADIIADSLENKDAVPTDPELAEIISDGKINLYVLKDPVKGLHGLILRELGPDNVLMQAWETFSDYDLNSNLMQARFDKMQQSIIFLGVLGTALAILKQVNAPNVKFNQLDSDLLKGVYYLLIIIPILITILVTATSRFKQGSKWLLLRAGAESIKREIYRYRTRAMDYKDNPEKQLAQMLDEITSRTMKTEVNTSSIIPYDKSKGFPPYMYAAQGGDDGFTRLTPQQYVKLRLEDQLNYFKGRTTRLQKQLDWFYWLTFIVGGIGTYLAAVDLQLWIALTTAIAAALGTYLGYKQTENTLTKYNQSYTNLTGIKAWWDALSFAEQSLQINIDTLVQHTEQVLQTELDGWIQQMQNALAELRKNQEAKEEKEENKSLGDHPLQSGNNKTPDKNDGNKGQPTNNPSVDVDSKESKPVPKVS